MAVSGALDLATVKRLDLGGEWEGRTPKIWLDLRAARRDSRRPEIQGDRVRLVGVVVGVEDPVSDREVAVPYSVALGGWRGADL